MSDEFTKAMNADRNVCGCDCSEKEKPVVEDFLDEINPECDRAIFSCKEMVVIAEREIERGETRVFISNNVGETIGLRFLEGEHKSLGQLALFLRQTSQQMAAVSVLGDAENRAAKAQRSAEIASFNAKLARRRVDALKKVAGL